MNIIDMDLKDMPGLDFECSCGKRHSVDIRHILTGSGILQGLTEILKPFRGSELFLLADSNTWEACGSRVGQLLSEESLNYKSFVFKTETPLVPDERALGRLLLELDKKFAVIIAVGSGTINDLTRMLSCRLRIPYIIVATAPSMDGYTSVVSPLIVEGFKTTYDAVYPYAVLADTDITKNAPSDMIRAGFGDIAGKFTALADWELSRRLNGEYYCSVVVDVVNKAVAKCTESADGLSGRDEAAIGRLTEALVLSGVAMGMVGNSRPASGSEHHLAHYWEMEALAAGREHALHGNAVGAASVVISSMYELLADVLPEGFAYPKTVFMEGLLQKAGCCRNPADIGIDRQLFRDSILNAYKIRERYSIMRFASSLGKLEELADILTRRFYA